MWIKDIHVTNKPMRRLKEHVGEFLNDIGVGEDILNQLEKENVIKGDNNRISFIKILNVCDDNRRCKNNCYFF